MFFEITDFRFIVTDEGDSIEVDFMGLVEILNGYLNYDGETDQLIFDTDDNYEYKYQITNRTDKSDIQTFFNHVIRMEKLVNKLSINII